VSAARAWEVLRKDLSLGPRSPLFLYALVFPVVATLLIQVVFGSLFEPVPRLGVVDRGGSAMSRAVRQAPGLEVVRLDSAADLRRRVERHDLDGGLVLPRGFDAALRSGDRPPLQLYLSGESLAKTRATLALLTAGLVRDVAGAPGPIEVEVVATRGGSSLPLSERLIPLLVMLAVIIAGVFVPSASLVEEKERRTLAALLVTPASMTEVMAAKGVLGLSLALASGAVTLLLNRALGEHPLALALILCVAALMAVAIGLILGALARDTNTLFSAIKGGNVLLMAPVIFFIWPDLPGWVPKLFPTYYFLNPLFRVAVESATLSDVWRELAVAAAVCAALAPAIVLAGRRMAFRLASS